MDKQKAIKSKSELILTERSILENFVVENMTPRDFDHMGTGSEIPPTEKIVT